MNLRPRAGDPYDIRERSNQKGACATTVTAGRWRNEWARRSVN
jgi:hypothetical protein